MTVDEQHSPATALRLDAKEDGDDTSTRHQRGTKQITIEDVQRLPRLNEDTEQHRCYRCCACANKRRCLLMVVSRLSGSPPDSTLQEVVVVEFLRCQQFR